jgi:hypothetical protein
MYVGTIHAYSFRLLQTYVPRYEAFDVLDENRLAAFLAREGRTLGVKQLDDRARLFASIQAFIANLEVVENELITEAALIEPFAGVYRAYLRCGSRCATTASAAPARTAAASKASGTGSPRSTGASGSRAPPTAGRWSRRPSPSRQAPSSDRRQ